MMGPEVVGRIAWGEQGAFAGAAWTIRRHEQWVVTGPNGAGKTYLALLLTGALPAAGATLTWAEAIEEKIALVTFSQQEHLASQSWLQARWHSGFDDHAETVRQFLCFDAVNDLNPFEVRGDDTVPRRFYARLFRKTVAQLDIADLLHREVMHLSNGETRKILLARALLPRPDLLLLDEPCLNLDTASRRLVLKMISQLLRARIIETAVCSAHHPDDVPRGFDRILTLDGGGRRA